MKWCLAVHHDRNLNLYLKPDLKVHLLDQMSPVGFGLFDVKCDIFLFPPFPPLHVLVSQ